MKRSRFSEEQMIGVLREQEAGRKVAEVCRKHGISEPTFYAWKAKFGGMSVSDAKRLKQLEDENAKLKKLRCGDTDTAEATRGRASAVRLAALEAAAGTRGDPHEP